MRKGVFFKWLSHLLTTVHILKNKEREYNKNTLGFVALLVSIIVYKAF